MSSSAVRGRNTAKKRKRSASSRPERSASSVSSRTGIGAVLVAPDSDADQSDREPVEADRDREQSGPAQETGVGRNDEKKSEADYVPTGVLGRINRATRPRSAASEHDKTVRALSRSWVSRSGLRVLYLALAAMASYAVVIGVAVLVIPFTGIAVAKLTGVTTSSDVMSMLGLWAMPMLSVIAMIIAVEYFLLRAVWRKVGRKFRELRGC